MFGCNVEALVIRYADDFVCAFQYKQDAELFYQQLNIENPFGIIGKAEWGKPELPTGLGKSDRPG